jgi:hypothetical protein
MITTTTTATTLAEISAQTLVEQVNALEAKIASLPERDREFAGSLVKQFNSRGLSSKQLFWVGRLLARVYGHPDATPQGTTTNVGNVKGIVDLLETAAKHLKRPAIVLRAGDFDIRLSIAGPRAKVPGSITVLSADRNGDETRDWYGRITREGEYQPSRKFEAQQTAIGATLAAMANDPAKTAGEYGRLVGRCCFCRLPLSDERSTEVGYGKICAAHFGLPWGAR